MTKGFRQFIHHAATPGILLMLATIAAMIVANSPLQEFYEWILLGTPLEAGYGDYSIRKPTLLWVNDGLMAIFFLLVGLELKREILFGELSELKKVTLPLFAACGGIAVPALIYWFVNRGNEVAMQGWAIPAATDIAFALGVLALLGSRVPLALKVFLTSVAVLDDLAAIVIIAAFYSHGFKPETLMVAGGVVALLFLLNRLRVMSLIPYLLLGIVLWVAVLKSGVHATLAGVVLAVFIPSAKKKVPEAVDDKTPLTRLEHGLHPWVAFLILPVFAFVNAGVSLEGLSFRSLLEPVPLGIAAGLLFGKQIGVMLTGLLTVKLGIAKLPGGVGWGQFYGVALLCGIGFTMSLFIGSLAFDQAEETLYNIEDRLGILTGSLISAVVGLVVLLIAPKKAAPAQT